MAQRFVNPTGGLDTNLGTFASPVKTINRAKNIASAGDEILILSGETAFEEIQLNKNGLLFTTYGGSQKAKISGFLNVTGWTSIGDGKWEASHSSLLDTVAQLTIDNVQFAKGRYPKKNTENGGWLTISGGGVGTITNSSLTPYSLVGSEAVIRTQSYTTDRVRITGQSGGTITFTDPTTYTPANGYGFYVQNNINMLTEFGDWMYNPTTKKITLHFGTDDPNEYTIKASAIDRLIHQLYGLSDFSISNIEISGSNGHAVSPYGGSVFNFDEVDFINIGVNGIYAQNHSYVNIINSTFKSINNTGVELRASTDNSRVENCVFENIGLLTGHYKNGIGQASGAITSGAGTELRDNHVNGVGYNGLTFEGNNSKIVNNLVENYCQTEGDGGGIYTRNAGKVAFTGMQITDNIVRNSGDTGAGTPYSGQEEGIYLDDWSRGILLQGNTVYNVNGKGIFLHNVQDINLQNNLVYNTRFALYSQSDTDPRTRNVIVKGNAFVSKDASQMLLSLHTNVNDLNLFSSSVLNFDENIYYHHNPSANTVRTQSGGGMTTRTFASWVALYGFDFNSDLNPVSYPVEFGFRIEVNPSQQPETISLNDGTYTDLEGADQGTTLELLPYGGKLLIKTSDTPIEESYDLEVRENPIGWGTAVDLTNESPYPGGTQVELQATPETWTQFYRWSRDGQTLSTNQNYLYTTRGQNDLVLGEFQPKQYPLVVTVTPIGGGTVNISSGNYTEGQQVPLVATNNTGYTFLNWQRNGEILSTNPSYTHTKTAGNETISAHFVLAKHQLTVTAGTGGTATGGGSFAQGETTSLVATVAGGYQFDGWYRDNVKLSGDNPYTYTARNQADTVQARFLRKSVAVISADPESGTKPLTVQFSSSGSVADSYAWDFGNGSTSFLALPYTIYQNAGTYTVTLTTTYGELTDTATMEITVTDPVYVPPTVKITSPQNLSANFEAPAKLPFRVLANSELGITKVEYWVNDELIATVTNAPYSYDWNNVEEGTYSIVAKAFDAEGSTESDPVSVTVYPPSEKYKLNGKELSDFGIIAGRAPNSNIAVSGHLDFPKRLGKAFHVWDDEEGVEPYVSYDEIKFEGRDIKFHGYVEGTDKNDVMRKLYAFYDFLNTLNGEVLFSCKWGSWLVVVQSEVEATQIKAGMVSIVVTFRQTDTGIQPIQSGGTADRGIDGINFGDLGFTYMNLKNQWYRPTTKDHHAIGYFTEPFQVTKAGAREMVLSGLLETETYQEMVSIVSSLYSLFAKEGVRTLQINNEPFREFFVKDGFQVTNIIIKHGKCMALLSINMMELNKPIFDPDFFTDTDGNYILSNTNQKIIIRK